VAYGYFNGMVLVATGGAGGSGAGGIWPGGGGWAVWAGRAPSSLTKTLSKPETQLWLLLFNLAATERHAGRNI
jgi:hypothetical protein